MANIDTDKLDVEEKRILCKKFEELSKKYCKIITNSFSFVFFKFSKSHLSVRRHAGNIVRKLCRICKTYPAHNPIKIVASVGLKSAIDDPIEGYTPEKPGLNL